MWMKIPCVWFYRNNLISYQYQTSKYNVFNIPSPVFVYCTKDAQCVHVWLTFAQISIIITYFNNKNFSPLLFFLMQLQPLNIYCSCYLHSVLTNFKVSEALILPAFKVWESLVLTDFKVRESLTLTDFKIWESLALTDFKIWESLVLTNFKA